MNFSSGANMAGLRSDSHILLFTIHCNSYSLYAISVVDIIIISALNITRINKEIIGSDMRIKRNNGLKSLGSYMERFIGKNFYHNGLVRTVTVTS